MKLRYLKALLLTGLFALTSCSFNGQYRPALTPCAVSGENSCNSSAIQQIKAPIGQYQLGFIEFDDQGQLRQREQMRAVVDHMTREAASNDVILTVFVHGWHHNAAPDDSNVSQFNRLLAKLAVAEQLASHQQQRPTRKVLGVYIAWRGDSIEIPWINNLTFWDRKSTAQEVGLQGVTEALLKLEHIVNIKTGQESEPKQHNSRMVVVGHSFGGAVLYTATQQLLADRYYQTDLGFSRSAEGFGDLTLLINPAFEALRFSTLYDIGQQQCRRYWSDQLPRLVVMTSEADLATRFAFPLGRIFSTAFETHDDIERIQCTRNGKEPVTFSEWKADLFTIGHYKPYWTHRLNALPSITKRSEAFDYSTLETLWSQQQFGGKITFEGSELFHRGVTHPLNPYLNIYVDKKLIGGHNDIWGEAVISFVRDLIMLSTTPTGTSKQ